jgi:hypothetical protein
MDRLTNRLHACRNIRPATVVARISTGIEKRGQPPGDCPLLISNPECSSTTTRPGNPPGLSDRNPSSAEHQRSVADW